jgi:hypothetical protein
MITLNCYATLAEYKAQAIPDGAIDAADDAVIEVLLKQASRYIDSKTARHFYPRIETRYYNVPDARDSARLLELDDDLLEIITLTNGDGTVLTSAYYNLRPKNYSPRFGIELKESTSTFWETDSDGNAQDAISVLGIWGYHDYYNLAWLLGSTAAEAMDASETGYDVTSATGFVTGNLIRFDNELGYVSNIASNSLTTTRGENGSTAATHLTAIPIYIWRVMDECKSACIEIASNAYRRRFGSSGNDSSATVTAAGVVLSPKEIPQMAQAFIETNRRKYL